MATARHRRCFLSFPFGDRSAELLVEDVIVPAALQTGWEIVRPDAFAPAGERIFESITKALRSADLIVAILPKGNYNVLYELGIAHGWGKRTVILTRSLETVPFDVASRFPVLLSSREPGALDRLRADLVSIFREAQQEGPSLADPALERYVEFQRTLSVELFDRSDPLHNPFDPAFSFGFVHQILELMERIEPLAEVTLTETRVGSLGTWISTTASSVAGLVEKILFFVPEWRMKNAQRFKVEAETELLLAQATRTSAEADGILDESARKDVELLFTALDKLPHGTARVTFGERLKIERTADGTLLLGAPRRARLLKPRGDRTA